MKRYLQQEDHVGFGQLPAVQSACSQTHNGHVTDSRVSICYTGQNLTERENIVPFTHFIHFMLLRNASETTLVNLNILHHSQI